MTISTLFYSQLASVFIYITSLFVLYRLIVHHKDASIEAKTSVIQLLNEQKKDLTDKLLQSSPDLLNSKLNERIEVLSLELRRLSEDKEENTGKIEEKNKQLELIIQEKESLNQQIEKTKDLIFEFTCPHCESPLNEKTYQLETVEDSNGRELDIDHEFVSYECGYSEVDGRASGKCRNS